MKLLRAIRVLRVSIVLLPLAALAREKAPPGFYTSYTGFAIPAEPVLPAHETHPSLWFRAGELPALTARCRFIPAAREQQRRHTARARRGAR